ncbi:ABC transporter substrate-binding protein [Chelatococcus reniformis]|uniref:ABC transporter substrate-binding protein n=1 Tax=Chelatococcus reniformis TaxID=1494448 RepID=A0A916U3T8_9HYPH|nr:ABC transporter substrate-binding protein [Chelatococcus reniformis]GGC59577.1 ABC transporter substrate-binding protein [Chelatococcus reniformis]
MLSRWLTAALAAALPCLASATAVAQKKYDPGASDTTIKIGNIMPYSGPASAYGTIGTTEAAYFRKINDEGGINGRKIEFISYDDGYSPPKAVEQVRKLVENDNVLLVFNPLGTPSNTAIQKYLNSKAVPQLFVATGATKWGDPKNNPWTMGYQPTYQGEARIYAAYILANKPDAKIGILYQNDDFGKDYLQGMKEGLGDKAASMIIAEVPYEIASPTIDNEILKLKASGADVLFNISTPKFAAQGIRKISEVGWKPMHILANVSSSVGAVFKPAGFENGQGILSATFGKDPTDPQWKDAPDVKEWEAFLDKYMPGVDKTNANYVYAYGVARTLVQVLKQAGDDLTRENIMRQAANLKNFDPGLMLPGITVNTGPSDFYPLEQEQMMRFKGDRWEMFGPVISGEKKGS